MRLDLRVASHAGGSPTITAPGGTESVLLLGFLVYVRLLNLVP